MKATTTQDIKKAQKAIAKFNVERDKVAAQLGDEGCMYDEITAPVKNVALADDGTLEYDYYDCTWKHSTESYIMEEDGEEYFDEYNFSLDLKCWKKALKMAQKIAEMENEAAKQDKELTDEDIDSIED